LVARGRFPPPWVSNSGDAPLPIDRCLLSLTGIQSLPETSPTEAFAMLDHYTTGLTAAGGAATPVSGLLFLPRRAVLRISGFDRSMDRVSASLRKFYIVDSGNTIWDKV